MAELAGLSIAANVLSVITFTAQVAQRLSDFQAKAQGLPRAFASISNELPTLVISLKEIERAINDGFVSDERKTALRPLIDDFRGQMTTLDGIIKKAMPKDGEKSMKRVFKAVASFRFDGQIKEIESTIIRFAKILTLNFVVSNTNQTVKAPGPPLSPKFICPFERDPDFVERAIMATVVAESKPGSRIALAGFGGIGKSQIAVELGYRFQETAPNTWVFWVNCESVSKLKAHYKKIAKAVRIPGWDEKDANTILSLVCDWLSNKDNGSWVIMLDNADSLDEFIASVPNTTTSDTSEHPNGAQVLDFLPKSSHGTILITSRDREVAFRLTGNYKRILIVEPMTESEAINFLSKKLDGTHTEDDMKNLVKAMDYMPLAISQAAAYISKGLPRVTVRTYLEGLKNGDEEREALLNVNAAELGRDKDRSNSIIATWQLSFNYIRQNMPSAARLLSLMCLFDRQSIPEALLIGNYGEEVFASEVVPRKSWWKGRRKEKQNPAPQRIVPTFQEDWTVLTNFSFIKTNVDGKHFSMHALVQFTTKRWLALHNEQHIWKTKYIDLLNIQLERSFPGEHEPLFLHACAAASYRPDDKFTNTLHTWANLVTRIADHHGYVVDLDLSEKMYRAASVAFKISVGADAPETLEVEEKRAWTLKLLGRKVEAEQSFRLILDHRIKKLGPTHLDTLQSMEWLGEFYASQGRGPEAEKLRVEALEIRLKTWGPAHQATQIALQMRALRRMLGGNYTESYRLFREAHEGREGKESDRQWAVHLTALGNMKFIDEHYSEAIVMFKEALEVNENVYGADDWNSTETVVILAEALRLNEEYEESEKQFRRAYEYCKKNFSSENREMLRVMNGLAAVLGHQGALAEAEKLSREALEIREKVLGEKHVFTLDSVWTLAGILRKQNQREAALSLYERAYRSALETQGEEGPDTKDYLRDYMELKEELQISAVETGSGEIASKNILVADGKKEATVTS